MMPAEPSVDIEPAVRIKMSPVPMLTVLWNTASSPAVNVRSRTIILRRTSFSSLKCSSIVDSAPATFTD